MEKIPPKIMTKLLPNDKFIPSGGLINILAPKTSPNIKYWLHSHLDGKQVDDENRAEFYSQVLNEITNSRYTTTDHLLIRCQISGYNVVFVSLDSSHRSEIAGHSLSTRLNKICENINVIMREIDNECILFLSEACKPSWIWDTDNQNEWLRLPAKASNLAQAVRLPANLAQAATVIKTTHCTDWSDMKTIIEKKCNLVHLLDAPNNDDPYKESYGIAAFASEKYRDKIKSSERIVLSNEGLRTAACVIRLEKSEIASLPGDTILIGVHLPLDLLEDKASRAIKPIADLQRPKTNNLGYKTAYQLCKYMDKYMDEYNTDSICAIGDFNTIYDSPNREISTWIHDAIDNSKFQLLVDRSQLTYFGSYFDVHQNIGQELTSIESMALI